MHMVVNIFVLTATGRLGKYKSDIVSAAGTAIKIIRNKMPLPEIDVVFRDNPENTIPNLGIGGFSNANYVAVALDPDFKNFDETIKEEIIRTLAHEFHHCARWDSVGYGNTIFEALVTEGLADHFDIEVTGKKPQAWDTALSPRQLPNMKNLVEKEFRNKPRNFWKSQREWFFGSKEKKIPKWTGYTLGFNIVKTYLERNPDKKPSQLFDVKAREFL